MYCILDGNYALEPKAEQQLLNVIDALHTHHGLCPDTMSNLLGTWLYPTTQDELDNFGLGDMDTKVML
jgi:hypothetical protein